MRMLHRMSIFRRRQLVTVVTYPESALAATTRSWQRYVSSSGNDGKRTAGGESSSLQQPSDEIYERKTHTEHILSRPEMYMGEIQPSDMDAWVMDDGVKLMKKKSVRYSPALNKIFDEILVNAADNKQRDKKMTTIQVNVELINPFTTTTGTNTNSNSNHSTEKRKSSTTKPSTTSLPKLRISVYNDGKGIPVAMHATEKMYIPELIFGHLLTGSNFNDTQNRLVGGRHGYGAKLTNIFSTFFEVETYDADKKLLYRQHWENNMLIAHPPTIIDCKISMKKTTKKEIHLSSNSDQVDTLKKEGDNVESGKSNPATQELIEYSTVESVSADHRTSLSSSPPSSLKNYTKITFEPDLQRFGFVAYNNNTSNVDEEQAILMQTRMLQDTVSLFKRRVYDVAACVAPSVTVQYNGEMVNINSFVEYVRLFSTPSPPLLSSSSRPTSATPTSTSSSVISISAAKSTSTISTSEMVSGEMETVDSDALPTRDPLSSSGLDTIDTIFHVKVNERWEVAVKRSNIGRQPVLSIHSLITVSKYPFTRL